MSDIENETPIEESSAYSSRDPNQQPSQNAGAEPEKGKATASLVLGIISLVLWAFFSSLVFSIIMLVLAIIGLVLAVQAKKAGNTSGVRKGGFVVSIIGVVLGALRLVGWISTYALLAM